MGTLPGSLIRISMGSNESGKKTKTLFLCCLQTNS